MHISLIPYDPNQPEKSRTGYPRLLTSSSSEISLPSRSQPTGTRLRAPIAIQPFRYPSAQADSAGPRPLSEAATGSRFATSFSASPPSANKSPLEGPIRQRPQTPYHHTRPLPASGISEVGSTSSSSAPGENDTGLHQSSGSSGLLIEYTYPDPDIAKAEEAIRRQTNPSHRALKKKKKKSGQGSRHGGSHSGGMYRSTSRGDLPQSSGYPRPMERLPNGMRSPISDGEDSDDEATKRKIERWRSEGNVQVIPTNAGRKSRPNHRQAAGNLRPALRPYATDDPRYRDTNEPIPYMAIQSRKSLPSPPGSALYDGPRGYGPQAPSPSSFRPTSPPPFMDGDRQRLSMPPPTMTVQHRASAYPYGAMEDNYGGGQPSSQLARRNSYSRTSADMSRIHDRRDEPGGVFSFSSLKSSLPPLGLGRWMGFGDKNRNDRSGQDRNPYGVRGASIPNLNDLLPGRPVIEEARTILPAEDLRSYLSRAVIPKWTRWQDPDVVTSGSRWQYPDAWGSGSTYAMGRHMNGPLVEGALGKEQVIMRLLDAVMRHYRDETQQERRLCAWNPRHRFTDAIVECFKNSVPSVGISPTSRWGDQIFAVSAVDFDTVTFMDPAWDRAEDGGLLGWLKGAILQTAVSALHMLRYNAQHFTFMVLPESVAPRRTRGQDGRHHFEKAGVKSAMATEFPDGCGTFVLANKASDFDRAMVVLVRPPWLVGESVLQAFIREKSDWRASRKPDVRTEAGLAELLQCQAYDDCVANHCFFFCVTTIKYWVFGHFNPDFSRCAYSPIMERKASNPSIMAVLVTWMLRAVDERPRDFDPDLPHSRPFSPPQTPVSSVRRSDHPYHLDPRQASGGIAPYGSFGGPPSSFRVPNQYAGFDSGPSSMQRSRVGGAGPQYGMTPTPSYEESIGPAYGPASFSSLGRGSRGNLRSFSPSVRDHDDIGRNDERLRSPRSHHFRNDGGGSFSSGRADRDPDGGVGRYGMTSSGVYDREGMVGRDRLQAENEAGFGRGMHFLG